MNAKSYAGAMPTLAVGMLETCKALSCPRQAWAWHPIDFEISQEAVA
jgi:hypothetical protein